MTVFDPIKAAHEELMGVNEVLNSLRKREETAEEAMSAAEVELNDIRKIKGFVQIHKDDILELIKKLEEKQKKQL